MPVHQPTHSELILPPDDADAVEAFAAALGVRDDYDLLLVGDGSGGTYRSPAGWGCIAYDRELERVVLHSGALTTGTVNLAELLPYIHALWHHYASRGRKEVPYCRVAIVSDSQVTVRCGSGEYRRRANGCLWAAVDWFAGHGYEMAWHHVPRNSNEWSELADWAADRAQHAARRLRKSLRTGMGG